MLVPGTCCPALQQRGGQKNTLDLQKCSPTQVTYGTLNSKLLDPGKPGKYQKTNKQTLSYIASPSSQPWVCIQLTLRTRRGCRDVRAALPASWGTAMPVPGVRRRLPTSAPCLPTLQKSLGLFCSSAQIVAW